MRTGPITKDVSTVQLGLSQIRVGLAASYISNTGAALSESDSLGAMAATSFTSEKEYHIREDGYPLTPKPPYAISETNTLGCAFKEITPKTLALSLGMSPATFSNPHAGTIPLGGVAPPQPLRVEAVYTFPGSTYQMIIIFPMANITSGLKLEHQLDTPAAVTLSIKAINAASNAVGGNAVWDTMPNGKILFLGG